MVCGDSTIIAKVAMIVLIVSVVCSTIAIFTPYWNETQATDGTKTYSGLVIQCTNSITNCISLKSLLAKYANTGYWTSQMSSLSLAMIGWVISIAAMVIMIIYSCCPNKITAIITIILCFVAGGCIVASNILYGKGFSSISDAKSSVLHWSFGLDVAAGGFALIAGVIVLINSCIIP